MKLSRVIVSSLLALGLVACGSTTKLQGSSAPQPKPQAEAAKGDTLFLVKPNSGGSKDVQKVAPKAAVVQVETKPTSAGIAENVVMDRVIYFDFDSFVVKSEFEASLQAQAQKMNASKSIKLVIAGHADERGSREYNLALGQKRAEAVRRALKALGVADDRIETISYGKEKPVDEGHNEAAWSKNRRAELMSSTK
jgi:peptidoglycan-associated lipoprotein